MIAWILVVISVINDVFRSHDLTGLNKGLWVLFIIMMPWLGVIMYLVLRGDDMQKRTLRSMSKAAHLEEDYIHNMTHKSTADELEKLASLKEKGVLSQSEFDSQKAKLLQN